MVRKGKKETQLYVSAWLPARLALMVERRAGKETGGNRSQWLRRAAAYAAQYMPTGWPETTREVPQRTAEEWLSALERMQTTNEEMQKICQEYIELVNAKENSHE
ncbi:MAG: hypothetical protein ACREOZ_02090 [Gloeomargaritales cyanobacterium]